MTLKAIIQLKSKYICHYSECEKQFNRKCYLNRNLKIDHNYKSFVCYYSGFDSKFYSHLKLDKHMKSRDIGKTAVECDTCGQTYATKACLPSHTYKMHKLFNQPMICAIDNCNKYFKNNYNLKRHQNKCHLFRDRYVCDYPNCDYKSATKEQLRRHQIVNHTNETPFECLFEGCGKAFKLEEQCNNHMKSHSTTILYCPHEGCDRTYHRKFIVLIYITQTSGIRANGPVVSVGLITSQNLVIIRQNSWNTQLLAFDLIVINCLRLKTI